MASDAGASSNPADAGLSALFSLENKELSSNIESVFTPQTCGQLFETLAEWNSFLENHVPYFSDDRAQPEEPQP